MGWIRACGRECRYLPVMLKEKKEGKVRALCFGSERWPDSTWVCLCPRAISHGGAGGCWMSWLSASGYPQPSGHVRSKPARIVKRFKSAWVWGFVFLYPDGFKPLALVAMVPAARNAWLALTTLAAFASQSLPRGFAGGGSGYSPSRCLL